MLMGRGTRTQPKRLKDKLRMIRSKLGITQQEMVNLLKSQAPNEFVDTGYISQFESGKREPSLLVLLAYAKLVGISTDALIDDRLELPE
jgi:transcriptional regulator with XRE-family HTH domain